MPAQAGIQKPPPLPLDSRESGNPALGRRVVVMETINRYPAGNLRELRRHLGLQHVRVQRVTQLLELFRWLRSSKLFRLECLVKELPGLPVGRE